MVKWEFNVPAGCGVLLRSEARMKSLVVLPSEVNNGTSSPIQNVTVVCNLPAGSLKHLDNLLSPTNRCLYNNDT